MFLISACFISEAIFWLKAKLPDLGLRSSSFGLSKDGLEDFCCTHNIVLLAAFTYRLTFWFRYMKSTYASSVGRSMTSADPWLPILAVRPHRWTKDAAELGGSYCITQWTSGISTPLAITSVQINTPAKTPQPTLIVHYHVQISSFNFSTLLRIQTHGLLYLLWNAVIDFTRLGKIKLSSPATSL